MSFWANVFLGKCLSWQMSFGQMSFAQMSFWVNVFLDKCFSGQMSFSANVFWANIHLHGQMSFWANVLWANVFWANVFLGRCLSGQMSLGKRHMGKCRITVTPTHARITKRDLKTAKVLFFSFRFEIHTKHLRWSVTPTSQRS
jgi:hypothetical protein